MAARGARAAIRDTAHRPALELGGDDPAGQARIAAFLQRFQQLGWTEGRNVRIDIRWTAGKVDDIRKYAAELVAFAPDVILAAGGSSIVGPLLEATRTVPIVFATAVDPVGGGFVEAWRGQAATPLVSWRTNIA